MTTTELALQNIRHMVDLCIQNVLSAKTLEQATYWALQRDDWMVEYRNLAAKEG